MTNSPSSLKSWKMLILDQAYLYKMGAFDFEHHYNNWRMSSAELREFQHLFIKRKRVLHTDFSLSQERPSRLFDNLDYINMSL